jgi:hypothetical protein
MSLDISIMSQEPIAVEIVKISHTCSDIISNVMKILGKKRENALLEQNFNVIFSTFYILKLSKNNPILGFYSKKAKYFKIRPKYVFMHKYYSSTVKNRRK